MLEQSPTPTLRANPVWWLISNLRGVRWPIVCRCGIAVGVLLLVVYCYLQHVALAQNQLIYRNPAIINQVRTVRVEGPVRIVTRIVETPGRVERETVEERGPVSTVQESLTVQTPVFPPAPRAARWIVGGGLNPFDYRDSKSWAAYGGYSLGGRLDLCAGFNGGRPGALVFVRF